MGRGAMRQVTARLAPRVSRTTRRARLASLLSVLALLGCSDRPDGPSYEYIDEERACLIPAGGGVGSPLGASDDLNVRLVFTDCGSACQFVEDMHCSAEVEGDKVHVSAYAEVYRTGELCPTVCVPLETTCSLGALPAGDYEVILGDTTRTVSIPGTDPCERDY